MVIVSYCGKGGMLWAQATMRVPSILVVEWYSNIYWIRTWGSRSYRKINFFFFHFLLKVVFFLEDFSVFLEYGSISVQFSCSVVSDSATPWIAARQASLSVTNSRSSFKLTSIESVMPSSHLILCCPLLLLPPIPPSIRVFFSVTLIFRLSI